MSRGERVIGYVRAGEGASRTEERAAIAAACKRPGWQLVRVEEDGTGGGKPGFPGLARALEALGAGEAEMLVVARLDRLVRSASEAARLLERAKRERWNLVALDLGLDLSTPAGRRVAKAFATVAEWERRLRSERTRAAVARRRAEGATLGTPRRAAAATVDKIGKLRAQGLSLQAIADELNRLRIPTARGGSKWRPSSVHSVLSRVS
jgi:DNA invertase Pin-like site-specific DNA recombinase